MRHWEIALVTVTDMGGVISRVRYWLLGPIFCRVLMVGLHNAGKSTVLCKLKSGDVEAVTRTAGFNVETVDYRDVSFTIWDIGGNQKVRHIWKHYYVNVKVLATWGHDRRGRSDEQPAKLSAA
ncbi:hypothetical protein Y032_0252g234 [Ancylostoma ceylanicum]|uniref:ADP-ribosylation factor family protein n=2 Tax=Ancylostoma ceylanicum TaxID=53326 RepID=A0A016SCP1_9BILA|nr:hypothetical protein Y032_0252g234 [Ancylostoma ceylanicum]